MNLGTWEACPVCGERDYSGMHRCTPQWEVRAEDEPDEWATIRARDAEDAACAFVNGRDSYGEYGQVIERIKVVVRRPDRPEEERYFGVFGELVPSYTAVAVGMH